jgi:hypothetical protein
MGSSEVEGSTGAAVSGASETGASVAEPPPQAASIKLAITNTNNSERKDWVISVFLLYIFILPSYQSGFKVGRRTG